MISHSRLLELLDYDPFTGSFTWVKPTSNRVAAGAPAGKVNARGYRKISLDGQGYQAHRLAWFYVLGTWPNGVIDHRDGDPRNNRFFNLRDVTQQVNTRNAKVSKNSRSGVNGVNWNAKANAWTAFIMVDRKSINLGTYPSIPEAARARQRYEQGLGFISRA